MNVCKVGWAKRSCGYIIPIIEGNAIFDYTLYCKTTYREIKVWLKDRNAGCGFWWVTVICLFDYFPDINSCLSAGRFFLLTWSHDLGLFHYALFYLPFLSVPLSKKRFVKLIRKHANVLLYLNLVDLFSAFSCLHACSPKLNFFKSTL